MLHEVQHWLPGTRCGWVRCDPGFRAPYLLPSFGLQSQDCCCGICHIHGSSEVLRTAGLLTAREPVWSLVVYLEAPLTIPTVIYLWMWKCEEDLICNHLIRAAILCGSFQHIHSVKVPISTILHHIYSLAIQRINQKMSCFAFKTLPVCKITLTTFSPLLTLVAVQEYNETFASEKMV